MLFKKLLVFPTNRGIREYLQLQKKQNQILPKTITIGEFFLRVVLPTKNKKRLDNDLRVIYLKEAIRGIDISKLGLSENFSKLYSNSEYIFKFFNELNSEYKTIEELETNDTYTFYLDHLEILKTIYDRYIAILKNNNLVDNITLPLDFKINDDFIDEFEKIILYYEGYFSKFEFDVINQIGLKTNLIIKLTLNRFNQKNIEMFEKIGIYLESGYEYILDISNKNIIKKIKLNDKEVNHTIFPVKQRITQIAVIKKSIVDMVNSGIEADKIAIILPDERFYKYLKLFDKEKYFNFAMGNSIENSNSFKKAIAINNYLDQDEPKHNYRIDFFSYEQQEIDKKFKPFWLKNIDKNRFFELIDFTTNNETNKEINEKLLEIKITLDNLLFKSGFNLGEIRLKDGFKIFLTKLKAISLDDVGAGKITVLGILETRATSFDGVIVIDFNDEKVPKRSVKDKFISSNVKKYSGLPTKNDRQDLQRYYYKRLFDKAKCVAISYVEDEQNSPSRFINDIFKKPNIKYLDFSFILQNNNILKYRQKQIIKDIDLSKLEWSATSLKTFLECKRKYYLSYILQLDEHIISLKPQNFEIGSIIHSVLKDIYKENNITIENINNKLTLYQNKNPYLTLELELWKKRLKKFINIEKDRFKDGIKIEALEKPFKIQYNNISLSGKIDRIDKLANNKYVVLDYKTSAFLKIDSLKTYEKSVDFQLEFYYLALKEFEIDFVAYYDLYNGELKIENLLNEKLKRLDEILKSLKTTSVDFSMCEDSLVCKFCAYKTICNK